MLLAKQIVNRYNLFYIKKEEILTIYANHYKRTVLTV